MQQCPSSLHRAQLSKRFPETAGSLPSEHSGLRLLRRWSDPRGHGPFSCSPPPRSHSFTNGASVGPWSGHCWCFLPIIRGGGGLEEAHEAWPCGQEVREKVCCCRGSGRECSWEKRTSRLSSRNGFIFPERVACVHLLGPGQPVLSSHCSREVRATSDAHPTASCPTSVLDACSSSCRPPFPKCFNFLSRLRILHLKDFIFKN